MKTWNEIIDNAENEKVLISYYTDLLIGNGGQAYNRLYLNKKSGELFENVEASCNTCLEDKDGNLLELHAHNNYGADLTSEEVEYLEENGLFDGDWGYVEFLDELEHKFEIMKGK